MENEKIMFLLLNSYFKYHHLNFLTVSGLMFEFFYFMESIFLIIHLLSVIFLTINIINFYNNSINLLYQKAEVSYFLSHELLMEPLNYLKKENYFIQFLSFFLKYFLF